MKNILYLFIVVISAMLLAGSCNGQPKTNYEIYGSNVSGATKYLFFLEKKSANPYSLVDNMDYLSPNVSSLKIGESTLPLFTVNLDNDGSEYKVGIVAVNPSGFYSGMGTGIGTVAIVPSVPATVGLRIKQ